MEQLKKRIHTIGKVCRIISNVLMVLMIVATSLIVISGIVLSVIPQDFVQADVTAEAKIEITGRAADALPAAMSDQLEGVIKEGVFSAAYKVQSSKDRQTVLLATEGDGMHLTLRRIGLSILPFALETGCLIAVFIMFSKLMKQLETCDSPFSENVVRAMSAFAFSLIPYAVVKPFSSSLFTGILFSGEISFGAFDFSVAVVVLFIFLLVTIFKYGVKLQKESDETL